MRVYRIQKAKYGADITGQGSNLVSGRWNVNGNLRVLYTSENKSLAILEKIESFSTVPGIKLPTFTLLEIEVPDNSVIRYNVNQLPAGWDNANRVASQQFAMGWLTNNTSLAISVPSVISGDHNILINPQHPDFNQVAVVNVIGDFKIDSRLIK